MTIFQIEGKLNTTKNLIITRLTWSFCLKYKYEERATLLMIKLVLDIELTQSLGCGLTRGSTQVWTHSHGLKGKDPTAPVIIANRHVGKGRKRRGSWVLRKLPSLLSIIGALFIVFIITLCLNQILLFFLSLYDNDTKAISQETVT
jgi:hypothetical protein